MTSVKLCSWQRNVDNRGRSAEIQALFQHLYIDFQGSITRDVVSPHVTSAWAG